ncbi:hypothetical protein V8F20_004827, partial [Naviculisporaceae sp. PSN 640]
SAQSPQSMDTRILTSFPTEGQPSPRITPITNLRNFHPRHVPGRSGTAATQLNRWFCCRCAERGYQDPVGIVNYSDAASSSTSSSSSLSLSSSSYTTSPLPNTTSETCWQSTCHHIKCPNCLASASHNVQDAIRTFGGLHASPRFIDPVYWECPCGEWAKNRFSESHATMGLTLCASPTCDFRYRSPQASTLRPDSIVMNAYGQRLGSADQKIAVLGGPWHWQRQGLGNAGNALLEGFPTMLSKAPGTTSTERRILPPVSTSSSSQEVIWPEGEPAPRYPYRRPPPAPTQEWSTMKTSRKSSNSIDGAADDFESQELEYKTTYLAGIRKNPMILVCDSGSSGGDRRGAIEKDFLGGGLSRTGMMSPPPRTPAPMAPRSHFSDGPSVGTADHVQIQMRMQMGMPMTTAATEPPTLQEQSGKGYFPRW